MGRSDNKKGPGGIPGTKETMPGVATMRAPPAGPEHPAPAAREAASIPRTTTDDPWRDLHPPLVWPD